VSRGRSELLKYLKFPSRTSHTYNFFCHAFAFIDHGKSNAEIYAITIDYNYTTTIFHERNDLVLFIYAWRLYNMNIRFNQKLMFVSTVVYISV